MDTVLGLVHPKDCSGEDLLRVANGHLPSSLSVYSMLLVHVYGCLRNSVYENTNHLVTGPIVLQHDLVIRGYICKDSVSKLGPILRY